MQGIRLLLLIGLIFRKLLLEVLKRRDKVHRMKRPGAGIVKFFKGLINVFLVFQILFLDLLPISNEPIYLRIIGIIIFLLGLATTMIGRLQLGKNWVDLEDFQVLPTQSLVTDGIYHYIRHPIYTGDLLLFVGLELALNSWLVLFVFLLIPIAIKQVLAEEAILSQAFPEYNAYCKRIARFIPFIF